MQLSGNTQPGPMRVYAHTHNKDWGYVENVQDWGFSSLAKGFPNKYEVPSSIPGSKNKPTTTKNTQEYIETFKTYKNQIIQLEKWLNS